MSQCETFFLPLVTAKPHQVREVLRCLIHTILFNRALGYVKPKDVDSELLDLTYVTVNDPGVASAVESHISEFCGAVERKPPADVAQVTLSFYERRQRQAWFGTRDERLCWEQWVISLAVLGPESQGIGQPSGGMTSQAPSMQAVTSAEICCNSPAVAAMPGGGEGAGSSAPSEAAAQAWLLRESLETALTHITWCVCEKRDHIPPVTSSASLTFPFDVAYCSGGPRSAFSLKSVKKAFLQASPPPMIA